MQSNITRVESDILKGVAIIMMLRLYLFLQESDIGNYSYLHFSNGLSVSYYLTRLCTPVSFFLMLSGYGLAYLYNENRLTPRTQLPLLLKLYIHYWWVLLVFVPIGTFVNYETPYIKATLLVLY